VGDNDGDLLKDCDLPIWLFVNLFIRDLPFSECISFFTKYLTDLLLLLLFIEYFVDWSFMAK
jgi:hypothetical protein